MYHTELILKSILAKNTLSLLFNGDKVSSRKDENNKKDFKSFLVKATKS